MASTHFRVHSPDLPREISLAMCRKVTPLLKLIWKDTIDEIEAAEPAIDLGETEVCLEEVEDDEEDEDELV